VLLSRAKRLSPAPVSSLRLRLRIRHSLKLSSQPSWIEIRRNGFSVRVVKPWNSLPQEVVMSPSVKVFESRLDKFWKNQLMMFDYKEELCLTLRSGHRGLRPAYMRL